MASQFNRYAAGRKVYGGGRSNPTSGTVDPTGYIERSANNMASERRSGLASSAISRRMRRGGPTTGVDPLAGIAGVSVDPVTGQKTQTAMPVATAPAPTPTPTGQIYSSGNTSTQRGPGAPINRAVESAGIMHDQKMENRQQQEAVNNWEPPLDPIGEIEAAEAEAERGRFLAELNRQENDFRGASARRLSKLQEQLPLATGMITDDFASRGMGFSGRHATERGNIEREYANRITGEQEDLTSRLADIANARGGKNSEIEAMINRIRQEAAARNADNPDFRAPVVTTANPFDAFRNTSPVPQDEGALEAIKRRLAGPWKRF